MSLDKIPCRPEVEPLQALQAYVAPAEASSPDVPTGVIHNTLPRGWWECPGGCHRVPSARWLFLGPVCVPGGVHMATTKFFPLGGRGPFRDLLFTFWVLWPASSSKVDDLLKQPCVFPLLMEATAKIRVERPFLENFTGSITDDRHHPLAQRSPNGSLSGRGCLSSTPASGRPGKPAPLVDRPDECIGHNAGIPLWAFGGILTRCVVKVEAGAILSCHAFRRSVCRRPTVPHTLSSDDVAERGAR